MKYRSLFFYLIPSVLILFSCSTGNPDKVKYLNFETSLGDIKLKLYNETPGHKENIIKLTKEGFYDGIKFHRIINEFMIQAGDPGTKEGTTETSNEQYNYTIPAEINASLFHKKGVLAAARTGDRFNPERESSGTQFYIVQGRPMTDEELNASEQRINSALQQGIYYKNLMAEKKRVVDEGDPMTDAEIQQLATLVSYDEITAMEPYVIPEERREVYRTLGGTPHLDRQYTVFGEIVEGQDVVDAIASVAVDQYNKPLEDIVIIKAKITKK
ncbi:MAG: peptidylprolyl isomerase [Bacteroidales bacterium]|nr:peptidylprolyl isomerase [Bacteroidales bacterium]